MSTVHDPCEIIRQSLRDLYDEWEDAERTYHYDPEMSGYYDLLQRQIEDANEALNDCERRTGGEGVTVNVDGLI